MQRFPIQAPAETPQEILQASEAREAYQGSCTLAAGALRARGSFQWRMAAAQYDQAADLLPLNPHTNDETIQARLYRMHAADCRVMVGTALPPRLLKDEPDYGRMQAQAVAEHEREWAA